MKKLSLDALKNRAEAIASEELMSSISGGTANSCHPKTPPPSTWDKIVDFVNDWLWP